MKAIKHAWLLQKSQTHAFTTGEGEANVKKTDCVKTRTNNIRAGQVVAPRKVL